MATQIGTNALINLSVGINGAAASATGFGTPLIVDTQNIKGAGALVPIIGTYASLAAVVAGGFASYTKAYKLAQGIFAQYNQQGRCPTVKIASVAALSSAELTAVEAMDPTWYLFAVTSMVSADIQTCSTWNNATAIRRHYLMAESQDIANFGDTPSCRSILDAANPTRTFLGCRLANAQVVTLTISAAFVAGNSVSLKLNNTTTGAVPFNATSAQTLTDLATAIQALFAAGVCTAAAAAGVITITALNPLIDLVVDTYACAGGVSQNTANILTTNIGAGTAVAELIALLIPQGLGQSNVAGKTMASAAADNITKSQYDKVLAGGGNVYVTIGNRAQWQSGTSSHFLAPGARVFCDTVWSVDRFEQAVNDSVLVVLNPQTGKLPFNNLGIAAVVGAIRGVCDQFVALLMLEPYNFKSCFSYPDISQVSPADKTARVLNNIAANLVSTGAIQQVGISISVQA